MWIIFLNLVALVLNYFGDYGCKIQAILVVLFLVDTTFFQKEKNNNNWWEN